MTDYSAAEFMVWGFMRDISKGNLPEKQNPTGINRWRVMEKDTMGKMDQVFGLMPGATISGTTTDNIYFFEKFRGLGLDPVFYMLPLATIVGGGHHSLLEVGLPLSSNGKGAYKVGLYSTLFPTGCQDQNRPAGVYEIENILRFAEGHPDNHLMLIYYDSSQQPAGCYLYENNDKGKWQRMCTGDDLLRVFRGVQAWPNRDQIILLKPALGIF